MKESITWIWFHELKGLTLSEKKQMLELYDSPAQIYNVAKEKVTDKNINFSLIHAEEIYEKNLQYNIKTLTLVGAKLAGFDTSNKHWPLVIYYVGKPPTSHSVALIGTRDLSAMGYYFVHEILDKLKSDNYSVYSGFASGVEKVAIDGALRNDISATAVLTHGLDRCYPRHKWRLMEQLAQQGTLISPYSVETEPNKYSFAVRNQLLTLMTRQTILVEASLTSNALSIARLAHEMGKPVYTIKGPHKSLRCSGNNELLKGKIAQPIDVRLKQETNLYFQHKIAQRLKIEPMRFDEIMATFSREFGDVTNLMLMLEHNRIVSLSSSGKWVYNGW